MKPALSACKDVINILTQYTVNNTDIFILKGWENDLYLFDYEAYRSKRIHEDLVNDVLPISLEIDIARLKPICMTYTDSSFKFCRDFDFWGPGQQYGNKPYYVVKFRHWVSSLGGSIHIETYNVENLKTAKELIDDYRKLPIKSKADTYTHKDEINAFINKWEKLSKELYRKVQMGQDF